MMKFLIPGLLALNLCLTGAILGMAVTGQIVAPMMGEVDAEASAEADAETEAPKDSFYFEIKPEIVVNFIGDSRPRNMLVSLTLVTYDEMAVEAMALHSPVIRNDLLLLFSGLESGPLMTREGKEALRKNILEIVRKIMLERYESEAVEDVYFTRFVMQ